ncbi:MAG: hypothetical protein F4X15_16255 [Gemmatimonadetes bacterium]|nr:hypothetical protein [Gemmatimonadota bacterium]MYC93013.1 hypothetical protein [Gemmatimonadota bacterium]
MPRWRVVLAAVAIAALPGGCGGDADPGGEDAAIEAAIAAEPTDTAALPGQTDLDVAGPAEGLEAGADTTDPAIDSVAGDTAGLPEPPVLLRVPPGTRVRLTAEIDISTDAYDVGDPVIATVVQDVMDETGETLIPRGTYFLGRVEASASSGGIGEPAILEVAFETLSAWNYERPIESVVVDAPMMLDPEAERARRSGSGRDALRSVPGIIAAGSVIVVQLREAVMVPPVDPLLADTAVAVDTVAAADTVPREQY